MPTGVAMRSAHATDFAANPAFQVKLILLVCAGIDAAAFRGGVYRSVSAWDQHLPTPAAATPSVLLSRAIGFGVITCGRLIAYL